MSWSCLVYVITLVWISMVTTSSSSDSDRLALLAIKEKINEDPLGALKSWNNSIHFCQWRGVTCSVRNRDRVTTLDLQAQKLEGTLSPYIGNLTFLTSIVLAENNFGGDIPSEIGHLLRLQQLDLSDNSFTGDIPTNLTRCSNLRVLYLLGNQLSGGIPTELSILSKLRVLHLARNGLQGSIPSSLGNLSSLVVFYLGDNNLTGSIPDNLCRPRNIASFQVFLNRLTGFVPSCLYNLTNMRILSLADNQLDGTLPSDIGLTLPNLTDLFVGMNNFRGLIPSSLPNASRFVSIDISSNHFTGQVPKDLGRLQDLRALGIHENRLGSTTGDDLDFITSLTNCSLLERLTISGNSLKGLLPNSIANLSTQMNVLSISNNQIYGTIPAGIKNLVNLTGLDFGYNNLTGEIPAVIGMLPKMQKLYLVGNQFTGEIPASIGNLSELSELELSRNKLHGRIPPSLGNCQNLFAMDLSNNRLNGTIPKEVVGLSSFRLMLNLWNNELSGSLPPEVGNLTKLVMFDVYGNKLSGPIPSTLGNCVTLKYLNLARNFFEKSIPQSLSNIKGLESADLSYNNFSGEIPDYLGKFTQLTSLNLSYNALEGAVPKDGVFANASGILLDGNSKLCGGAAGLKLLPCRIQTFKKNGNSLVVKVVLPVIVVSLCLVLLCFFMLCRRKMSKRKPSSPSSFHHQYMRISYAELLKATNNFSADNLIGAGSYGSVYKGVLDQVQNIVAVKVFNLQQQGASKSFLSECNALRNLRHRNLLKIITSCSSVDFQGNDFKALVFEFMPNGSLEDWLHPNPNEQQELTNLNFLQRLNISIDVALAVDYLHHQCEPSIVHCDIKPSNVLLNDDMTAHVADFGLAKIFSTTSYIASQGEASSVAIKGSIGYVAPEYGMGREVSTQGDVYSYGILMLEMFTGKRPTDSMFQNGLSLHGFAKMALAEQVMNIVDQKMFLEDHEAINIGNQSEGKEKLQQSLASTLSIGVKCSAESPIERMNIGEVVPQLCRIRDYYLGVGFHSG